MPHHHERVGVHVAGLVAVALAGPCAAQATFTPIGDLAGGSLWSRAVGVSPDGTAVTGASRSAASAEIGPDAAEGFVWTGPGSIAPLGFVPLSQTSGGRAVSNGGGFVALFHLQPSLGGTRAFRWSAEGQEAIGTLTPSGGFSSPQDITPDGGVVVGTTIVSPPTPNGIDGFMWTPAGGIVSIGGFGARAVTPDAAFVAGLSDDTPHRATRWTEATGHVTLPELPGGDLGSTPNDISPDGGAIVGFADGLPSLQGGTTQAFRWRVGVGMQGLGVLPGGDDSRAEGVSAAGDLVVGVATTPNGEDRAVIWDEVHGLRELGQVLTDEFGVDLTGWTLTEANDVSWDGRTIVGTGVNPDGHTEGFVAVIPAPGAGLAAAAGLTWAARRRRR